MDKYEILIEADHNDGDYITQINTITLDDLELIKPLIQAIKDNPERYNWCAYSDTNNPEAPDHVYSEFVGINKDGFSIMDIFNELIPYDEYGIHTITKVEVYSIPEKERLL